MSNIDCVLAPRPPADSIALPRLQAKTTRGKFYGNSVKRGSKIVFSTSMTPIHPYSSAFAFEHVTLFKVERLNTRRKRHRWDYETGGPGTRFVQTGSAYQSTHTRTLWTKGRYRVKAYLAFRGKPNAGPDGYQHYGRETAWRYFTVK
jgi:hypothetical protein